MGDRHFRFTVLQHRISEGYRKVLVGAGFGPRCHTVSWLGRVVEKELDGSTASKDSSLHLPPIGRLDHDFARVILNTIQMF